MDLSEALTGETRVGPTEDSGITVAFCPQCLARSRQGM
jgi:hypothetical protein